MFIATLCGLAFALITLGAEVFYYKRKQLTSVSDLQSQGKGGDGGGLGATAKANLGLGLPGVESDKAVLLTKSSLAALAKQRRNAPAVSPPGALGPQQSLGIGTLPAISGGAFQAPAPPGQAPTYISVFPRDLY